MWQLSSHVEICVDFDSLLVIPAILEHGMMLGSIPRVHLNPVFALLSTHGGETEWPDQLARVLVPLVYI